MQARSKFLRLLLVGLLASGCATARKRGPIVPSILELHQLQSRTYSDLDSAHLTRCVLEALQDQYFVCDSTDLNDGVLSAERVTPINDRRLSHSERVWISIVVVTLIVAIVFTIGLIRGGGGGFGYGGGSLCSIDGRTTPDDDPTISRPESLQVACMITAAPVGTDTEVRINVVRSVLDHWGHVLKTEPVTNPEDYQTFFKHLDKALFLAKNN